MIELQNAQARINYMYQRRLCRLDKGIIEEYQTLSTRNILVIGFQSN